MAKFAVAVSMCVAAPLAVAIAAEFAPPVAVSRNGFAVLCRMNSYEQLRMILSAFGAGTVHVIVSTLAPASHTFENCVALLLNWMVSLTLVTAQPKPKGSFTVMAPETLYSPRVVGVAVTV